MTPHPFHHPLKYSPFAGKEMRLKEVFNLPKVTEPVSDSQNQNLSSFSTYQAAIQKSQSLQTSSKMDFLIFYHFLLDTLLHILKSQFRKEDRHLCRKFLEQLANESLNNK